MPLKTTKWDGSEHLRDDADIAAYVEAALEDGETLLISQALSNIARAKGMTEIARDTGVSRETLYVALNSDESTGDETLFGVMKALKIRLSAVPLAS